MTYFAEQLLEQDIIKVVATSDQSISSSTTLTNDSALSFSADANSTYQISMLAIWTCAASANTVNAKWDFSVLTSASWVAGGGYAQCESGGVDQLITSVSSGTGITQLVFLEDAGTPTFCKINAVYVTAGTSGTVNFRWAQNTSNATAVIRELGSYMLVRKID